MPIAPTLKTPRLILRALEKGDAEFITKQMNDWEITRYFVKGFPNPYTIQTAYGLIGRANHNGTTEIFWAITLKSTNEMIGLIDLRPEITDTGQRGFWIAREHQNKGYMSEALHVVNDYWFDTLEKDILIMRNAEKNDASNRLKEKTGARLRETIKGNYNDDTLDNAQLWEMTKDEWQTYKATFKKEK